MPVHRTTKVGAPSPQVLVARLHRQPRQETAGDKGHGNFQFMFTLETRREPPDIRAMTEAQEKKLAQRIAEYAGYMDLTPGMESMIWTLACVEVEEHQLQEYVDIHGTCYQVVGKSGDTYSRARPEWQQLKEARMRKQALIARIENKMQGVAEEPTDVETYFG